MICRVMEQVAPCTRINTIKQHAEKGSIVLNYFVISMERNMIFKLTCNSSAMLSRKHEKM